MSEASFKCPHCGKQTFGVIPARCNEGVLCPNCLKSGVHIVMIEDKNYNIRHIGDGIYIKNKLNESTVV